MGNIYRQTSSENSPTEAVYGDIILMKNGKIKTVDDKNKIVENIIEDASTTKRGSVQLATQEEVTAGTVNNKAITPNTFKKTVSPLRAKKLIATFTVSGTFTIANYGLQIGDEIDAYIVGAGAGGSKYLVGGGGGYCKLLRNFKLANASYSITIGKGGAGTNGNEGTDGGSSSAFGITMPGGKGNGSGGSAGGTSTAHPSVIKEIPMSGSENGCSPNQGKDTPLRGGGNVDYDPINPYDGRFYGCGGGSGAVGRGGGSNGNAPNGGSGNIGGGGNASPSWGGNGGIGGGGGGSGQDWGGTGGDGIVYIYA